MVGVRKCKKVFEVVEKFFIVKIFKVIEEVNVVLLVIDVCEGIVDQDLSLLGYVLNLGCLLVIVVNKWDGLDIDVKDDIKCELDCCFGFVDFVCFYFILVLYGIGVGNLFELVNEVYRSVIK